MSSAYIPNSSRRASSTHPTGVRPFAWTDMDSNDEKEQIFAELFEEEMAAAAQDEEHMLILACMSNLFLFDLFGNLSNYLLVLLNCNVYL
jgi:hypothetical protein